MYLFLDTYIFKKILLNSICYSEEEKVDFCAV